MEKKVADCNLELLKMRPRDAILCLKRVGRAIKALRSQDECDDELKFRAQWDLSCVIKHFEFEEANRCG